MKHKTYIDTTDMYQTDIRQDKLQIGQLGDSHVSNKSHIKAHGQRQMHLHLSSIFPFLICNNNVM